jgi:DNA-binding transcriptional ArsR family regulator
MRAEPTAAPEPQAIFAALADPTRRSLVGHLAGHSPKTATQLATVYPITRQGILKHLAVLEDAGLVRAQQAGREKRYSLTPAPSRRGSPRSARSGTPACCGSRRWSRVRLATSRPASGSPLRRGRAREVGASSGLATQTPSGTVRLVNRVVYARARMRFCSAQLLRYALSI